MKHSLMNKTRFLAATLLLAGAALHAQDIQVTDAWVRSTVQGQMGSGAFMKLTSKNGAKLVGVTTPVAGVAEVHEMKMDGDVMKMRAIPALDLPAGKTVELKPGGFHVMLMELRKALPKNSTVPMTLMFKDARGVDSKLEIKVPVSTLAPRGEAQHKH